MRDIRALFAGLGDLRAELTVLGRYLLSVVDEKIEILIGGLNAELADWIAAWAPTLALQDRAVLAALGVNGILGARFATSLFHQPEARIPDDRYLTEWTAQLATRIETLRS